ncbi:MAG: serine/threonine-protein kinase [Clostridia bacterium]|nr:serine/threonine-protein kinase [Clostridia bacterium]
MKFSKNDTIRLNEKDQIAVIEPLGLLPARSIALCNGKIGYLMDLRPKNFVSFVSYLTGKHPFKNRATMLKWCIKLCTAFKKLHEMGYSYQDLNDGSFFMDPDTGDLLICDNDNVTADKKNLGILGKMRYMAPEIVRGEQMPDVHSDRFSLAVTMFR